MFIKTNPAVCDNLVVMRFKKDDLNRIGISVSKKVFYKATIRNYIRRVVRDVVRRKNKNRHSVFFIYKNKTTDFKAIEAIVEKLLKEGGCTM